MLKRCNLNADDVSYLAGSGEFLLIEESKPEEVKLVVRTINSSAFSDNDWKELVQDVSEDVGRPSTQYLPVPCSMIGCL